jgi:hypothetical protein
LPSLDTLSVSAGAHFSSDKGLRRGTPASVSDETMKNVVQLVRDTRKSKDDKTLADIVDWSFAKKAQAELKLK